MNLYDEVPKVYYWYKSRSTGEEITGQKVTLHNLGSRLIGFVEEPPYAIIEKYDLRSFGIHAIEKFTRT